MTGVTTPGADEAMHAARRVLSAPIRRWVADGMPEGRPPEGYLSYEIPSPAPTAIELSARELRYLFDVTGNRSRMKRPPGAVRDRDVVRDGLLGRGVLVAAGDDVKLAAAYLPLLGTALFAMRRVSLEPSFDGGHAFEYLQSRRFTVERVALAGGSSAFELVDAAELADRIAARVERDQPAERPTDPRALDPSWYLHFSEQTEAIGIGDSDSMTIHVGASGAWWVLRGDETFTGLSAAEVGGQVQQLLARWPWPEPEAPKAAGGPVSLASPFVNVGIALVAAAIVGALVIGEVWPLALALGLPFAAALAWARVELGSAPRNASRQAQLRRDAARLHDTPVPVVAPRPPFEQ